MAMMLASEYSEDSLNKEFHNCCSEHVKCSGDLEKLAEGIEQLHRMRPAKFADQVADMEYALQQKCSEIKKQRSMITQLLT